MTGARHRLPFAAKAGSPRRPSVVGRIGGRALDKLVEFVSGKERRPHIVHMHQALQEGQQAQQLAVCLVVVPGLDGNAVGQLVAERLRASQVTHVRAWRDMLFIGG